MVSKKGPVPYHMQDSSDDESSEAAAAKVAGSDDGQGGSQSERRASGLKGMLQRKVKVGDVQLDPEIDYADWSKSGPGLSSRANLTDDGTISIWVDLKKALPDLPKDYARPVKEWATDPTKSDDCPPLNIVIFIVGSRGDVQPYVSLALHLIKSHAHRVRIATHPDFKDFVIAANSHLEGKQARGIKLDGRLEFYDIGGNVKELMAYMVKNPGLLPGWETIKSGDIGKKRTMTAEMLQGFYASVLSPDPASGKPFAADAIISNPPAFGHVHIAEALGLPLLMSFTMPWCPTTEFKHPLVNIKSSNAEKGLTNYFTFGMAELLTWQGLGDVINQFRAATLGLEPLTSRHGAGALERLKVPWTYCWSQGLIEKPDDWKENIDISGFYFFESESDFKPDDDLAAFLASGDAPVYIGFGSVVVEDPTAMTKTILEAVEKAGVRALVSAGWGGLGGVDVPDSVFILKGSIPHDWLFANDRVSAVCHHGGAGTTAIGLRNGLPTIVVPFFGDQQFWGDMIHRAGAGPQPIPHRQLTVEGLANALKEVVAPEARMAAGRMGEKIRSEKGEERGVKSFHRHLPLKNMLCEVDPSRAAMWYSESLCLRISGEVAGVLHEKGKLDIAKLRPLRAREYAVRAQAHDPISGGSVAVLNMVSNHYSGIAQIFYNPPKGILNTMFAIPQGMLDLIIALHEGFDAIPTKLGSEVRPRGQVDDFGSGVVEGGKGLFWGWWDGITGLATEPVAGGRKEGALGVIKGMGRSYVNVTARPAAGVLGMMALPIHGAWKSIRRKVGNEPEKALSKARRDLSLELAKFVAEGEKKSIVDKVKELEKGSGERREKMKKRVKLFLLGDERAFDVGDEELAREVEEAEKRAKEGQQGQQGQSGQQGQNEQGEVNVQGARKVKVNISGGDGGDGGDGGAGGDGGDGGDGGGQGGAEGQGDQSNDAMASLAQEMGKKAQVEVIAREDEAGGGEGGGEMTEAERRGYERAMREMRGGK